MTLRTFSSQIDLHVLVVEDDYLLAETLVDALSKLGCSVAACASNFDQAMLLAADEHCDVALVDIDLRGVMAYPILDVLHERGVGFVIASGTELSDLPPHLSHAPIISKPYDTQELYSALKGFARNKAQRQA